MNTVPVMPQLRTRATDRQAGGVVKAALERLLYGSPAAPRPDHLEIQGIGISCSTRAQAIAAIIAPADRCRIVNFANARCLNIAREEPDYREALAASDLILPDGSGLAMACRLRGQRIRENLNGTDLFPFLCQAAAEQGLSLYLLGAAPGIAEAAAANMCRRIPSLRIAGTRDGYFDDSLTPAVIDQINASGADLVFVAMGVPKQELWLRAAAPRLQARCALGVGGLFDYYSGRIARAPAWLRGIGMEPIWRLAMELRRGRKPAPASVAGVQ